MRCFRAIFSITIVIEFLGCRTASSPAPSGPDAPIVFPDVTIQSDRTERIEDIIASDRLLFDESLRDPIADLPTPADDFFEAMLMDSPAAEEIHDSGHDESFYDAGCTSGSDCPPGFWCDAPQCRPCNDAKHCGATCLACDPGHQCWLGNCVECVAAADCEAGHWCDDGTCVACRDDDAAHCGSDCEPCIGERPACVAGECSCTSESCGIGRRCVDGSCRPCDSPEACGPDCVPCGPEAPFCKDAGRCVQCLDASHCGADDVCLNGSCLAICALVQGCAGDPGPDGKKCGSAKVIGRIEARNGYVHNGDTTNDGNNDDLQFPLFQDKVECWDANEDNFFRLYLMAGDRLDVTLTPLDPLFDSMLKLYRGTGCKAGGDPYDCFNNGADGKPDSIVGYLAPADGWVTLVVDGRRAFDEDGDWGPYTLTVRLTCARPDCCCPTR